MNHRDVTCPNCGTVYAVGYSAVPHSVEKIHRICDTCMMPIEVKNPWNDKGKDNEHHLDAGKLTTINREG